MSLRGAPLEAEVTIPGREDRARSDGRPRGLVHLETGARHGDRRALRERRAVAAVNTVLDADQTDEARELLQEIVTGLESGELQPTAGAIEPLADRLR